MADLIIYNGSDKVIKRIVELLNQGGGGGGGNVDDVKVNGTSVVDANKVAQIDLTPYAKSADLAAVATTGSYDDLTDKPTIPAAQVQSDWLEADTSAKSYILNKPTIPSAQVQSDWNEADSSAVDYIKNKPNLATVATSGSYTDLSNKPTDATQSASGLMSSTDKTKLDGIASGAEENVQSDWSQSDNTADDYIKNKPTIPTVNDGTLTLKNGDQTKGTFSANQSTAANVVMLPFDITGNTTIGFTPVYPS